MSYSVQQALVQTLIQTFHHSPTLTSCVTLRKSLSLNLDFFIQKTVPGATLGQMS